MSGCRRRALPRFQIPVTHCEIIAAAYQAILVHEGDRRDARLVTDECLARLQHQTGNSSCFDRVKFGTYIPLLHAAMQLQSADDLIGRTKHGNRRGAGWCPTLYLSRLPVPKLKRTIEPGAGEQQIVGIELQPDHGTV